MRLAVWAGTGVGGTEKAATTYAAGLAQRGYEVDYLAPNGPRSDLLKKCGVRQIDVAPTSDSLRDYLKLVHPDIIHQHAPGYPVGNPLYSALREMGVNRPKLIETNVFGRLEDAESEGLVDFRLFITMASGAQAAFRAGLKPTPGFFECQTVVYYPVAEPPAFDEGACAALREELRIPADDVLAVRVGRPGGKWAAWECEAFRAARETVHGLRLFLMEPPHALRARIERGVYGEGIVIRPVTSDFDWLARLYAASDLMIHTSDHGESFGYTIAEGMAAGLPVITRSTPWADNAQVELVRNGESGFVCWSVPEMGRRLVDLAQDRELRENLGRAAKVRILGLAAENHELDVLEEVIACVLHGKRGEKLRERTVASIDFAKDFRQLERQTSERNLHHKFDQSKATAYSAFRKARSAVRASFNRMRRRQIVWQPKLPNGI